MIKIIFQDRLIRTFVLIQIGELVIYLVILFVKYSSIPQQIPLFYSHPRGPEQLADSSVLLIIPVINFIILTIHTLLSSKLYGTEKMASYIIVIISLTSNTLIFITILRIIFLVS